MPKYSLAPFFNFARVKLIDHVFHNEEDSSSSVTYFTHDNRYKALCHNCLKPAGTTHSLGHRRLVQDLPFATTQMWLDVEYRKVWCDHCQKVRVEHLEFCDSGRCVTKRLARYIHHLCRELTNTKVAEIFGLSVNTVRDIDKRFLQEEYGETDYSNLRILAVDEIAVKKGHTYMTVIMDYMTGRIVWMGKGRKAESLDEFFAGMTQEQKDAIEAVAMDMWEAYIKAFKQHCKNAKIVFDFFHLVKAFGTVIDDIRREEYAKASEEDQAILKGSKYLLLKNEVNLTEKQVPKLEKLLEINKTLNEVYILKDMLKKIFFYDDRDKVKKILDDWCEMAGTIAYGSMRKFINKLRFFEYGILNHADYPIGTSELEGTNNKIKVIKRNAYGYRDLEYFTLKVKQAFDKYRTVSTNFFC